MPEPVNAKQGDDDHGQALSDTDLLDHIEHVLKCTGSIEFIRSFDGDVQFNTEASIGLQGGSSIRDAIARQIREGEV